MMASQYKQISVLLPSLMGWALFLLNIFKFLSHLSDFHLQDKYRMEIKDLQLSDAGEYKVIIKNKCGEKSLQGVLSLSGKIVLHKILFSCY